MKNKKIEKDVNRHKSTGTNSCNHLITQSPVLDLLHAHGDSPKERCSSRLVPFAIRTRYAPSVRKSASHLITSKAAAFTLAEVLITLAVIGIVAALTLPGLIQNHNEKAWSTAQDVFTKRLEVATRQMNTEEKLAGYSSTMDFVNELKKYIKITNVCDSDNLSKCFEKNIMSVDNRYVDTSSLKTSAQLAKEDWGTETVGVQFANGINALIAYNTQRDQQPFNNQFSASAASMAILYDVSGNKNPNIIGKDINQNANVKTLGCMIQPDLVGGMCISQILAPGTGYSPMTYEECRQAKENGEIDVEYCYDGSYGGNDYFAGAVKACGGKKANLPTMAQLGELATYVYNHDSTIGAEQNVSSLTLDTTKASQFLSASPDSDRFFVWSEQENVSSYARGRYFSSTGTYWNSNLGNRFSSDGLAVCLGD